MILFLNNLKFKQKMKKKTIYLNKIVKFYIKNYNKKRVIMINYQMKNNINIHINFMKILIKIVLYNINITEKLNI